MSVGIAALARVGGLPASRDLESYACDGNNGLKARADAVIIMTMRGWFGVVALGVVFGLGACSSDESSPGAGGKCTPGQSASCACTDGRTGAQECQGDGTFAACVCTGGSGGNAGQTSGGSAGQSTGGTGSTPGDSLTGEWSKVFPSYFEIAALDVDDEGTLVVAGISGGPVDFGNGPVGGNTSGYNRLLMIVGYDSNGERKFAFAKDAGRMYSPSLSIRAVSGKRIIVAGLTTVTHQGSGPSSTYTQVWPCGTTPASIGNGIQFVVELDQAGNCLWDHTYPAAGYSVAPTSVVLGTGDSAYVGGIEQYYSTRTTRRYLADGTFNWEKPFGGTAHAGLSNGSVLIATYDGLELPSGNVSGLFAIAKLDPAGNVMASTGWGTPAYDPTRQFVGMDAAADRVAVAVRYTGSVDLGGGPLTSTDGGAGQSKLFALFDSNFGYSFARSVDEPKSDSGNTDDYDSRAILAGSKAVYTGSFWRTVDFGTGALQAVGTSDDDLDVFIASYSFDGTPLVARRFGGDGTDGVRAVTADDSGTVYLAGYFSNSVDFGDGIHDNPPSDSGVPTAPTFLVKLRP